VIVKFFIKPDPSFSLAEYRQKLQVRPRGAPAGLPLEWG